MAKNRTKRDPSVKKIINKTRSQLSKESRDELYAQYKKVRRMAKKRLQTYIKHGREEEVSDYIKALKYVRNKQGMVSSIGLLSNFLLSNKRSYTSFIKRERKLMKKAEEDLGREFISKNEYNTYKDFLKAMYERDKAMWKKHYDDAMDIYDIAVRREYDLNTILESTEFLSNNVFDEVDNISEMTTALDVVMNAKRLKLDISQFEKNFKYWMKHNEELDEMEPIRSRKKSLTLSDYEAKQGLKLPRLRGRRKNGSGI